MTCDRYASQEDFASHDRRAEGGFGFKEVTSPCSFCCCSPVYFICQADRQASRETVQNRGWIMARPHCQPGCFDAAEPRPPITDRYF